MSSDEPKLDAAEQRAWEEHNLAQMRYFRSLSLREKMAAVDGMAEVVRRFEKMRASGDFTSASEATAVHEPPPNASKD